MPARHPQALRPRWSYQWTTTARYMWEVARLFYEDFAGSQGGRDGGDVVDYVLAAVIVADY
jgi:hypothetical protein